MVSTLAKYKLVFLSDQAVGKAAWQHNFNSPTVIDRQINSSISFGMEG
jgi:hypothetical protein